MNGQLALWGEQANGDGELSLACWEGSVHTPEAGTWLSVAAEATDFLRNLTPSAVESAADVVGSSPLAPGLIERLEAAQGAVRAVREERAAGFGPARCDDAELTESDADGPAPADEHPICLECGKQYRVHPWAHEYVNSDGWPYLRRMCLGGLLFDDSVIRRHQRPLR